MEAQVHSEIIRLAALHVSIENIAVKVGLPKVAVSVIVRSPLAQAEIARRVT